MDTAILFDAARKGDAEKIKGFIAAGGDVNVKEGTAGHTALMIAAARGHADCVQALIAAGADVNAHTKLDGFPGLGLTALILARNSPDRTASNSGDFDRLMAALVAAGARK